MDKPLFHKTLLPVNDSPQSERAVQKAIELYQAGVIDNLVLFNVYDTSGVDITKLHSAEKLDELRAESLQVLEKYQKMLADHNIPCTIKKAGGDPASLILDLIENDGQFDLIIMGSRRLNKFQELAFGSVTDKVTRLVNIPVLVIK
ncbi:Nucleotide-binding universal stress protein, UspA family [Thermosyntropha lipolytica DSM 11003]|uniref:Nucleotide-binding universal stress protein, UspA family n=1 Tax=Thermosyntropha lipolytica DSM 11003 TaxID=1123382 RepID=A0A1M5PWK0_9FIRM|nr:universal stress protein [Thermosyntropha lipolytica]SHH06208.1 Nucleotide-binding universal stress protein, UspA family [Thermosyntropha lipolytica DSM 11003]